MSDVSVVMGTYNGAPYIREQLLSILLQTEPPCEILIGDDGSTDDTLAIVAAVAAETRVPIRVERNATNLGFSENFLRTAARANGRYIAFSDQDDRWLPEKLATCRAALVKADALLCAHVVTLIDAEGRCIGQDLVGIDAARVIEPLTSDPWGVYFGFTMLFDRRLLEHLPVERRGRDSHNPKAILSHDRWVYFLASSLGRTVTLAEPLADYRQHGRNLYGIKPVSLRQRVLNKIEEGPPKLKVLAELAAQRENLLAAAGSSAQPAASRAAAHWGIIGAHCRRRYELYLSTGLVRRLRLLIGNCALGTYGPFSRKGLGAKRLIEDATLGVFGPLVLPRSPHRS